jgi:hypothetical protein
MAFFSGLLNGLRRAVDPARLTMTQALIQGDYGAAAAMAQRFRQLQAERDRFALQQRRVRGRPGRSAPDIGQMSGRSMAGAADGIDFATDEERAPLAIQPMIEQVVAHAAKSPPVLAAERRQFEANMRLKGVNGYGYVPQQGDHEELAQALFSEAVGSRKDMAAVAGAILNRVRPGGRQGAERHENAPTLSEVLRLRNQFPFMPNRRSPSGSREYDLYAHPERMTPEERRSLAMARRIAGLALAGKLSDPTGGSTFYFASHDYDGSPGTVPYPDFQRMIEEGALHSSRYRSPYPRIPGGPDARRPTYFFDHRDDIPQKR